MGIIPIVSIQPNSDISTEYKSVDLSAVFNCKYCTVHTERGLELWLNTQPSIIAKHSTSLCIICNWGYGRWIQQLLSAWDLNLVWPYSRYSRNCWMSVAIFCLTFSIWIVSVDTGYSRILSPTFPCRDLKHSSVYRELSVIHTVIFL